MKDISTSIVTREAQKGQAESSERLYSVYAIRCKASGRMYIGCGLDVEKRVQQHLTALRNGHKTTRGDSGRAKSIWQKDYDQYGEESFEYYILQKHVPKEKRMEAETYWMIHYNTKVNGYNLIYSKRQPLPIPFVLGRPPEEPLKEEAD